MLLTTLIPQISNLIPYDYTQIQKAEYEFILNKTLTSFQPNINPKIIHTLGIPGSGKSTFCKKQKQNNFIYISFDHIMEQIPAYHHDIEAYGSPTAFKNWEIPARVIGYELLRRAIEKRLNILFEHSGATAAHLDLLKNLRLQGYEIEIDYIQCNINKALLRAKKREDITHRHTPPEMIKQRASVLVELCSEYKKIADVFRTYDNSFNQFILKEEFVTPQKDIAV